MSRTEIAQENLDTVKAFYLKRKRFPSYREMEKILNYKTGAVISFLIFKWKSQGLIRVEGNKIEPTPEFFGYSF